MGGLTVIMVGCDIPCNFMSLKVSKNKSTFSLGSWYPLELNLRNTSSLRKAKYGSKPGTR